MSPAERGVVVGCEACGARTIALSDHDVRAFAMSHQDHTAGDDYIGLGDAVHAFADPIRQAVGRAPCTPCEARRRELNNVRMRRFW